LRRMMPRFRSMCMRRRGSTGPTFAGRIRERTLVNPGRFAVPSGIRVPG
jgi:hypothetical protein